MTSIIEVAKKRFRNHSKFGGPVTLEDFIDLLTESYNNGLKCCYCRCQMYLTQAEANHATSVVSVDHRVSLWSGGRNERANLCLCCVGCNLLKGTSPGCVFEEIVGAVLASPVGFLNWNAYKVHAYAGQIRAKLDRIKPYGVD